MKTSIRCMIAGILILAVSCSKSSLQDSQTQATSGNSTNSGNHGSPGVLTQVYYDSKFFTINLIQMSDQAAQTQIARNPSINIIYEDDAGLPGGVNFVPVIDAIPTDGMNAIWREVQISFNPGVTPKQFFSDNEILAAASGPNPSITLTPTDEVYTCPVITH